MDWLRTYVAMWVRHDWPWLDRTMLWCSHRYLSAIEVLNVLALVWWWYLLQAAPERAASGTLQQTMQGIAPLLWWGYVALLIALVKLSGVAFQKPLLLIFSAMFVGVWWSTLGVMNILATNLYGTPSVYFIVVAASLFRIFELTVQIAQRQRDSYG